MSLIKDLTDPLNPYTKYWKSTTKEDLPSNANNIIEIDFDEFKKNIIILMMTLQKKNFLTLYLVVICIF